jgi:hypothetical protein
MNVPIPDEAMEKIKEAIFRGSKIEAIHLYRESTGSNLLEAKTAVEQLEVELRAAEPNRFAEQPPVKLVGGVPLGCLLGSAPFVAMGAVFLVYGIQDALSWSAFAERAVRTEGTVVRLDNKIPGKGHSNTQCRAVISYQVGGETFEVHGFLQVQPGVHGGPKGYQVGEAATLLYDPDRPGEAKLDSIYVWVGPLIPCVLGLTFLLLGIGLWWAERRKWRRKREQVA